MAYRIAILYLISVLALLAVLGAGVYVVTERTLVGTLEADLQTQARRRCGGAAGGGGGGPGGH